MTSPLGAASVNGLISSLSEARLPALDRGLLFGHALFETLLVLKGHMVSWEAHWQRLSQGCKRTLITLPCEEILNTQACQVVAAATERLGRTPEKMQLRIVVTGGSHLALWDDSILHDEAHVVMLCREAPNIVARQKGITLKMLEDMRPVAFVDLKSCNYLPNMLALAAARRAGYDDSVFVSPQGFLTECTTASLVWIDTDGTICSTPAAGQCLPGTTIETLARALEKAEHPFAWRTLHQDHLPQIRGMFMVSSVRGLVPIRQIDSLDLPLAPCGAMLTELLNLAQEAQAESS